MGLRSLLREVRDFVAQNYPGEPAIEVSLKVAGQKIKVVIPPGNDELEPAKVPFVPTPFQKKILEALDGKALKTDTLANAVGCDRTRLHKPNSLPELREHGLVAHMDRLGFYRPDAPPQELVEEL